MITYPRRQFDLDFPTSDACLDALFQLRYGWQLICPGCGVIGAKYWRNRKRRYYECQWCGYCLSPTAGTIFHQSSTPLKDWFYIMFLFANAKNGVSAAEIQRQIGVTYKCAWRIGKQIRRLMAEDDGPLSGIVEVDETYLGAKGEPDKTVIMGAVTRNGPVKTAVVSTASVATAKRFIAANLYNTADIYTDSSNIYTHLSKTRAHLLVNHSAGEYARGLVHTNTIEGYWGHLKAYLRGTYHAVSPKYLPGYLDYFSYHYNHRGQALFPLLLVRAAQPVEAAYRT